MVSDALYFGRQTPFTYYVTHFLTMKISSILIILLGLVGCNNANTSKQNEPTIKDSIVVTTTQPIKIQLSPQVDSIDKANAITIKIDGNNVNKASISKKDSSVDLTANMKLDHRIFGYEKPDTSSKKKILLSIFTDDVKNNPFNLPDGAYYSTSDMQGMSLKFVGNEGAFVKINILKRNIVTDSIFIQKTWVEFDD